MIFGYTRESPGGASQKEKFEKQKEMLKEEGVDVLGFHLGRKVVLLHHIELVFEAFIHMQIIMCEMSVAFIRVKRICWDDVEMVGAERHTPVLQQQSRSAFHNIEYAGEG